MDHNSTPPENDLHKDLAALRAEVAELRQQVKEVQALQSIAVQQEMGAWSIAGLRRFGALMYFITLPLALALQFFRTVRMSRKRFSFWRTLYTASFAWVYLRGKEMGLFVRLKNFYPTFRHFRTKLEQGTQ